MRFCGGRDEIMLLIVPLITRLFVVLSLLSWLTIGVAQGLLRGDVVAFSASRNHQDYDIFILDVNLTIAFNLTRTPVRDETMPSWSPDGTQLAFSSALSSTGNITTHDIYVINADGSNVRQLTDNPANDWDPVWSPDGMQIAFASNRAGYFFDIYVMDVDGNNIRQLTANQSTNGSPAWSPDGSQIAFVSSRNGSHDIYVMTVDGNNQHPLIEGGYKAPAWSPDGTQFAFFSELDGDIYVRNLESNGTFQFEIPANWGALSWLPGRSLIVFLSYVHGQPETYILNSNGSYELLFAGQDVGRTLPVWRPT